MDSTLILLKEEINKTNEAEHDLAKWKLGVTAALGAAALGVGKDGSPPYWLLLSIPFVCAYVDLFVYQYELRIQVIARFLRNHGEGDATLQRYEQECEVERKDGVFSLSVFAEISCSLGASVLGLVFYLLHSGSGPSGGFLSVSLLMAGLIWLAGVLSIFFLWKLFKRRSKKLSGNIT
jgi:hypothetical protein